MVVYVSVLTGQIVPDFKLYNNINFPDAVINNDTIHVVYGNYNDGIIYFNLDTGFNAISDTLLVNNTIYGLNSSIDARNNNIASSWVVNYGLHKEIQGTVFRSNNDPQIASIRLDETPSDNSLGSPSICFLNDTLLASVWHGNVSTNKSDIRGQLLTIDNELIGSDFWVNEFENIYDDITSRQPLIKSFEQNSDFVIAWIDDRNGEDNIYGRLFDSNSIPKDSSFLISDTPTSLDNFLFTSMGMDNAGNFVVVWSAEDSSGWNIFYRWFNKDTQPITSVITLTDSLDNVHPWADVCCSISENGESIISWESDIGSYNRIVAQRFNNERKKIGEPFRISTVDNQKSEYYIKIILYHNKIYSLWRISGSGVWANVLDFNNPVTSIEENELPTQFTLSQNYPNPLNPTTTIEYELPEAQNIKLQVFDITGHLVETLYNGFKEAGHWDVTWDAGNYSSGIYIYRLEYGDKHVSRKMVLMK